MSVKTSPNKISDKIPVKILDKTSDKISDKTPDKISDKISVKKPDKITQKKKKKTPEKTPHNILGNLSDFFFPIYLYYFVVQFFVRFSV